MSASYESVLGARRRSQDHGTHRGGLLPLPSLVASAPYKAVKSSSGQQQHQRQSSQPPPQLQHHDRFIISSFVMAAPEPPPIPPRPTVEPAQEEEEDEDAKSSSGHTSDSDDVPPPPPLPRARPLPPPLPVRPLSSLFVPPDLNERDPASISVPFSRVHSRLPTFVASNSNSIVVGSLSINGGGGGRWSSRRPSVINPPLQSPYNRLSRGFTAWLSTHSPFSPTSASTSLRGHESSRALAPESCDPIKEAESPAHATSVTSPNSANTARPFSYLAAPAPTPTAAATAVPPPVPLAPKSKRQPSFASLSNPVELAGKGLAAISGFFKDLTSPTNATNPSPSPPPPPPPPPPRPVRVSTSGAQETPVGPATPSAAPITASAFYLAQLVDPTAPSTTTSHSVVSLAAPRRVRSGAFYDSTTSRSQTPSFSSDGHEVGATTTTSTSEPDATLAVVEEHGAVRETKLAVPPMSTSPTASTPAITTFVSSPPPVPASVVSPTKVDMHPSHSASTWHSGTELSFFDTLASYGFRSDDAHPEKLAWLPKYAARLEQQEAVWSEVQTRLHALTDKEYKALTRAGIPAAYRARVWWYWLGPDTLRRREPLSYYATLTELSETQLDAETFRNVIKDVDRTFTAHPFFKDPQGEGVASLRRVLLAYALRNPDIGYCQSMNFLAGFLLLFYEEEEAFWMLCVLLESFLPPEYYTHSMVGVQADVQLLLQLIEKRLPKIWSHLLSLECMSLEGIFTGWFLCLFIKTTPVETTLRILDSLFVEGTKVLFRVSLALMEMHEAEILACDEFGPLFECFNKLGAAAYDCDALMKKAFTMNVKRGWIEKYRAKHVQILTKQYHEMKRRDSEFEDGLW